MARLVAFDLAIVAAGLIWEVNSAGHTKAPLSWSIGAVGVVTFLVVLLDPAVEATKEHTRFALTLAFTVVYFVVLGLMTFYSGETTDIAKTLLTNFTVLMGVVVAFYFGGITYEKVAAAQKTGIDASATRPDLEEVAAKPEGTD